MSKKVLFLGIEVIVLVFLFYTNLVAASDGSIISGLNYLLSDFKFFHSYNKINRDENFGSEDWNLILVNANNPVPDDYEVELLELSNGERVDVRIYEYLQEMMDAARMDGLSLFVAAGYRSRQEQEELQEEIIKSYEDEGFSRNMSIKLASERVAEPGTSEHELGIAVDINADYNETSSDTVYKWLSDNAYKYGFILRYPSDKTDITGIMYEPWHYRFVGIDAAKIMYEQRICLEEYR